MLRLTKKAGYGLMALKYLAEHADDASLSARDIAEAHHIPLQLLAKSLQRLTKTGILRSRAGTNGGYSLLKPPQQVSVFDVICAINGPLFITSWGTSETGGKLAKDGAIKEPLARVNDSITDLLRNMSIANLAEPLSCTPQAVSSQELFTIQMCRCSHQESRKDMETGFEAAIHLDNQTTRDECARTESEKRRRFSNC
ncbi:MAG: RrF2 family transcriptional regulator [Acidobacteriota bacterium]